MVQWLEDPSNQAKFRKGSLIPKKTALTSLVNQLPNKTSQQVSDRCGNLKRTNSDHSSILIACDGIHDLEATAKTESENLG